MKTSQTRESNGIVYITVTSDGTTGEEWIRRLRRDGFRVGGHAAEVLRSPSFKLTKNVTTEIAIIKGTLFKDDDRTIKKVMETAAQRKFVIPNTEVACLLREALMDWKIDEMGLLDIVIMHESMGLADSIQTLAEKPLLYITQANLGRWIRARFILDLKEGRSRKEGFAYAVS